MIDALKSYPAMKGSAVPWLGDVPEHWQVVPNRASLKKSKIRTIPTSRYCQ